MRPFIVTILTFILLNGCSGGSSSDDGGTSGGSGEAVVESSAVEDSSRGMTGEWLCSQGGADFTFAERINIHQDGTFTAPNPDGTEDNGSWQITPEGEFELWWVYEGTFHKMVSLPPSTGHEWSSELLIMDMETPYDFVRWTCNR